MSCTDPPVRLLVTLSVCVEVCVCADCSETALASSYFRV